MSIVVFGSINMDLVVTTERLPQPGETLTGNSFRTVPGGKGANQAVACARLGAPTVMVGRVGQDGFGQSLQQGLLAEGIDTRGVQRDTQHPSGVALITVEASGENSIVVVPGANGQIGAEDLVYLEMVIAEAQVLLLQLEVPLTVVQQAAQIARQAGVMVMLDPAPAQPLPDELLRLVDLLTPNEHEAGLLVGFPITDHTEAERAASLLRQRGAAQVLMKRGAHGATLALADQVIHAPAFAVTAVDTVAAGDAFNAGVAVALAEGQPLTSALRWGLAAGAIAVTRVGAQTAMPRREEVLPFLGEA